MERSTALRLLPGRYGRALELADQGFEGGELAALLDVDTRALGPLLQIARAKLAALELLEEPSTFDEGNVSSTARTPSDQWREEP